MDINVRPWELARLLSDNTALLTAACAALDRTTSAITGGGETVVAIARSLADLDGIRAALGDQADAIAGATLTAAEARAYRRLGWGEGHAEGYAEGLEAAARRASAPTRPEGHLRLASGFG